MDESHIGHYPYSPTAQGLSRVTSAFFGHESIELALLGLLGLIRNEIISGETGFTLPSSDDD